MIVYQLKDSAVGHFHVHFPLFALISQHDVHKHVCTICKQQYVRIGFLLGGFVMPFGSTFHECTLARSCGKHEVSGKTLLKQGKLRQEKVVFVVLALFYSQNLWFSAYVRDGDHDASSHVSKIVPILAETVLNGLETSILQFQKHVCLNCSHDLQRFWNNSALVTQLSPSTT
jgi:hypothetical protein